MSKKFIEVITEHPTTEDVYKLLLQVNQIVQIQPEVIMESEPKHEPVAVVIMTSGDTLILKNTYHSLMKQLDEMNMVVRP